MRENIEHSYKKALHLLQIFCQDEINISQTSSLAKSFATAFQSGNKLLICGNGGSACDAMHFAEEFTGRYRKNRKALPVIALTDPAHITCVANDFGYAEVFARGVEAYGKPGDWLIGLSTSGNSENVVRAVNQAKALEMKTLALLGKDGGSLKGQCDFEFIIPAQTADRIQEIHMMILHVLIEGVERILFPEHYQ
jgi:D-sedoheptulose 7-phosphate isomerase